MRTCFASVLLLLATTALGCDRAADDEPAGLTVRPDGIGTVRVGMTLEEASVELGEELEARYADFESCDHVVPASLPGRTALMVVRDTIVRIEVTDSSVATSEGARVGSAEAHLLELYGERASVTPHKYSGPEGHYVTVLARTDSAHAIVFETDGARVQRYRAGRRPEVAWVEGCA